MKKKRRFRFKGVFRRKGKKNDKNASVPKNDGDDSSVYSVNFDASSRSSTSLSALDSAAVTTIVGDPIHVVVLVLDPNTRRFEILQLEFDSAAAKVSDIFAQIAASATEPNFKSQIYEKLTNVKGEELLHSKSLAEYFDSAGIVIAVPSTTVESGSALAKMANPILTNPKVHAMLISSGLELPDLPEPVTIAEIDKSAILSSDSSQENKTSKDMTFPLLCGFSVAIFAVGVHFILSKS